jgi:hypothetical protein
MIRAQFIVIAVIIYLFYDLFLKKNTDEIKDAEIDKELKENSLTYPKSQYYTFADTIESASANAGTDENAIFNVFKKLKNNNDFLMLEKAFGRRVYTGELFGAQFGMLDYSEGDTLNQWLTNELDQDEISDLNKMLSRKGIKYRI